MARPWLRGTADRMTAHTSTEPKLNSTEPQMLYATRLFDGTAFRCGRLYMNSVVPRTVWSNRKLVTSRFGSSLWKKNRNESVKRTAQTTRGRRLCCNCGLLDRNRRVHYVDGQCRIAEHALQRKVVVEDVFLRQWPQAQRVHDRQVGFRHPGRCALRAGRCDASEIPCGL